MRKPWTAIFVCEQCKTQIERVTVQKNAPRFCNKSCANKWQHATGSRRAYFADKTIEEWWKLKYTEEEIALLRQKMHEKTILDRRRPWLNRCSPEATENALRLARRTWDEKFGKEKSSEMKEEARKNCGWIGKSVEERLGPERAEVVRRKAAASNRGKKRSSQIRKKMSIAAIKSRLEKPDAHVSWGIKGWYKGFFFRSSYEYFFMKKLENEGLNLKSDLQQECFRVPYVFEGQEYNYVPDFYVPSRSVVFEVKNDYSLASDPIVACKHEAAKAYFLQKSIDFVVVSDTDLPLPENRRKIRDVLSEDPCVFISDSGHQNDVSFEQMFNEQLKFMNLLVRERGFTNFPVDLTTKDGQKIVKNISHECMHELFEAVHLLSDAKDHKKSMNMDFDKEKFVEELSDALHYFIGVCILCDIDAKKMFDAFMRKGTINFSRILGGY